MEEEIKSTDAALEELLKALHNTPEYLEYARCLEIVRKDRELYLRMNALRRTSYLASLGGYEEIDKYSEEIEQLRKDKRVAEFMNAELGLCGLIKDIHKKYVDGIGFDGDFLR